MRANKKDMQAVFDELEDIYTLIPGHRHNELDKAQAIDALVGENRIFLKPSQKSSQPLEMFKKI